MRWDVSKAEASSAKMGKDPCVGHEVLANSMQYYTGQTRSAWFTQSCPARTGDSATGYSNQQVMNVPPSAESTDASNRFAIFGWDSADYNLFTPEQNFPKTGCYTSNYPTSSTSVCQIGGASSWGTSSQPAFVTSCPVSSPASSSGKGFVASTGPPVGTSSYCPGPFVGDQTAKAECAPVAPAGLLSGFQWNSDGALQPSHPSSVHPSSQ